MPQTHQSATVSQFLPTKLYTPAGCVLARQRALATIL